MEEAPEQIQTPPTFRQKILVCIAAIAIVCGGLWFVQHRWMWRDPAKIKVDPEVEQKINTLLEEARTGGYRERMTIFYEIQDMGRDRLPVLARALQHEDPRVRAFSANLLQYCDNASVIPHLEARLNDENSIVRRSALSALGYLGASESAPTIILVLNDKDNFTRCQAALVLGNVGGDRAVLPLIQMLGTDPYPVARRTAAHSLGEIGNKEAVPTLIDSLEDSNHYVRSASLVALNRITGADLGPSKKTWSSWWAQRRGLLE
ncbi:HEAT repeat domain-containing protein [Candidatus Poribacteria bacterium]|nr:HEAT repeat domain-containing protein [Candidatus Poribacteria bacterium]